MPKKTIILEKKEKKRSSVKPRGNGPPPSAVVYRGPSKINKDGEIVMVTLTELTQMTTTSSSNSGVYNASFKASDIIGFASFSDFQDAFSEYRVLSVHLEYVPKFEGYQPSFSTNGSSGSLPSRYIGPLVLAPFHGNTSGLTSSDEAANHAGRKLASINMPFSHVCKMKDTEEARFISTTAVTSSDFGFKTYFQCVTEGASDVINWGSLIQTSVVQFRTRVKTDVGLQKDKKQSSVVPSIKSNYENKNKNDKKDEKENKNEENCKNLPMLPLKEQDGYWLVPKGTSAPAVQAGVNPFSKG